MKSRCDRDLVRGAAARRARKNRGPPRAVLAQTSVPELRPAAAAMNVSRTPADGAIRIGVLAVVGLAVVLALLAIRALDGGETPVPIDRRDAGTAVDGGTIGPGAVVVANERGDGQFVGDAQLGASAPASPQGRVVDVAGNGIAGVGIGRMDGDDEARLVVSDDAGSFALRDIAAGTRLGACDERWETLVQATVGDAATVVVAPRVAIAGTVVGDDGRPIEGAMLSIAAPAVDTQWLTFSDRDGAFAFAAAPGLAAAQLCTQHRDHFADERALPLGANLVTITLRTRPRAEPVQGTVFGPDGAPFANANVRLGDIVATSGADGTFALGATNEGSGTKLFVVAAGCAPVAVDDPRPGDGRPSPPLVVSLRPEITIAGRLVDASGMPLPEWTVAIADPTPRDSRRPVAAFVEGELGPLRVVTDDAGRFSIGGVFARRYTVEAWDHRGERGLRAEVAPADGNVTIIAHERDAATLRGIVVDGDGRPVAGVVVGEQRPGCATAGAYAMRFDQRVCTRSDGGFELPLRGAALHVVVDGDAILPCRIAIPSVLSDSPLRLEVARSRAVAVTSSEPTSALQFAPTDGDGVLAFGNPSPGAFAVPHSARSFVVHHHGVLAGTLPMPANGAPLDLRVQSSAR